MLLLYLTYVIIRNVLLLVLNIVLSWQQKYTSFLFTDLMVNMFVYIFSVSSIASFIQTMDHRIFRFAPDGSA